MEDAEGSVIAIAIAAVLIVFILSVASCHEGEARAAHALSMEALKQGYSQQAVKFERYSPKIIWRKAGETFPAKVHLPTTQQ